VKARTRTYALGAILAIFVTLATTVAVATPAFESSDEPSHYLNIQTLVAGHWYQMRPNGQEEAHQPPLYYLVLAGLQQLTRQPAHTDVQLHVNPLVLVKPRTPAFVEHSSADHRRLLWLRGMNILLGAATVLCTYFGARLISDGWTPIVAAAVVATMPRFVFLSASLNNDNLANLLGAAFALSALGYLKRRDDGAASTASSSARLRHAAVVVLPGIIIGLCVVTKLSMLPFAAVLPFVYWRRWRHLLLSAGCALVTCSWYLAYNWSKYGDPLARAATERYLIPVGGLGTFGTPYKVEHPLHLVLVDVPSRIAHRFWYTSGWETFRWPTWRSLVLWALLAVMLIGLRRCSHATVTLGAIVLAGFSSVWFVAFQTETYAPRLALTALPALALLAALGTQRWPTVTRFALPVAGIIGTLVALRADVFAVHW
jgi:4-amino-4-deoxy-L-arabinose transferase-like glycosyltransferase